MAAANLLVAVFIIPHAVRYLFAADVWFPGMLGQVSCRLIHYIDAISTSASILGLITISLNQAYTILFPIKRVAMIRNTKFISLVIWLSSVIFTSPYLAMFGVKKMSGQRHRCVYVVLDHVILKLHVSFIFVFLYGFPLVFMATLYALMGRKLWFRRIPGNIYSIHRHAAAEAKRNGTRMLIVVIAIYALSWLPPHVLNMCRVFEPNVTRNLASHWSLLIAFIAHANCALNPCIQMALNRKFRAEFLKLWNTWRNMQQWCIRKKEEVENNREAKTCMGGFKALENALESLARGRGRLYDLSPAKRDGRPRSFSPIQLSYYKKAVGTES
ncbi:orexin receptor type 2-like [Stylophora pistillata]|uniref:orexin receptor type 2-like n=1 Tax=Stylophora pistillata TaxID=50429 RepID=UPI000C04F461|nr:orexin receptor type 2-like [Stylophora pistillata]